MKLTLALIGLFGIAIGIGLFATRDRHLPPPPQDPIGAVAVVDASSPAAPVQPVAPPVAQTEKPGNAAAQPTPPPSRGAVQPSTPAALVFNQALDALVSPGTSFDQKQSAWGQLRSAGKLDQAIGELESRIAQSPGVAEIPAALGQAYLQKAGTIDDIREQGILGMKADQTFEAALNTDPQNWDARFWKTTAMSYWPPQLGKGKTVIENCLELLKQQEVQPPRPEFAQVYVLLGDMYEREGAPEFAQQAWKRGLALFPNHQALTAKASAAQ